MNNLDFIKLCDASLPAPDLLQKMSIGYRDIFLNKLDLEYWRSIDNITDFFELFRKVYSVMSLCPTKEVYNKYDEILNKKVEYKWNLGAQGFLSKIEQINRDGKLYMPVNFSFLNWYKYLDEQISFYCRTDLLKVMANLEQFENKTDKEFLQKLRDGYDPQLMFENYFRRKKYNAGNKKEFDLVLDAMFDDAINSFENLNDYPNLNELRSAFMAELKGDTEKGFLARIFYMTVLLPDNPKMDKYVIFFDLLQYLLKDKDFGQRRFITYEDFKNEPVSYDGDYRKYQKSEVMNILSLR